MLALKINLKGLVSNCRDEPARLSDAIPFLSNALAQRCLIGNTVEYQTTNVRVTSESAVRESRKLVESVNASSYLKHGRPLLFVSAPKSHFVDLCLFSPIEVAMGMTTTPSLIGFQLKNYRSSNLSVEGLKKDSRKFVPLADAHREYHEKQRSTKDLRSSVASSAEDYALFVLVMSNLNKELGIPKGMQVRIVKDTELEEFLADRLLSYIREKAED